VRRSVASREDLASNLDCPHDITVPHSAMSGGDQNPRFRSVLSQ
jgi:hypothetical protein